MADFGIPNRGDDDEQSESDSDVTQRKSLVGHVVSTRNDDEYIDASDWDLTEEELDVAFGVTSPKYGSGQLKDVYKQMSSSGSHHEWVSQFQLAMAHLVGEQLSVNEFEQSDLDPQGIVPLFNLLKITTSDLVSYIEADDTHEEFEAEDLADIVEADSQLRSEFLSLMSETDGIDVDEGLLPEEPAAADD